MTRPKTPAPRRRRRICRVLIAVLLVAGPFLIVAGIVEALRRSDLPRALAIDALRDATGLDVRIGSLRVGWLGGSTAREVEVFLPLEGTPLFTAPEIRASHASLVRIVLTQQLSLSSIEIDRPHLSITRDDLGRWSAARAFEPIAAAARARPGADQRLPALTVRDGVIEFASAEAFATSAFQLDGCPAGGGWMFEGRAEGLGTIDAQFDPGVTREHLVRFDLAPDPVILRGLGADLPDRLHASGMWRGFARGGEVSGILTLDRAAAGAVEAAGAVRLAWGPAGVRLEPLSLDAAAPVSIRASGGAITWHGGDLALKGLTLALPGAATRLDASWRASEGTGRLEASWTAEPAGPILEHDGAASFTIRTDEGLNLIVEGIARSTGRTPEGRWSAESRIDARAASLREVRSRLEFPHLAWTDERGTIDLSRLTATIAADPDRLRLLALEVPGTTRSEASGVLDLAQQRFAIELDIADWRPAAPSHAGPLGPIDLALTASGDAQRINIDRARLGARGATVSAQGWLEQAGRLALSAEVSGSLPLDRTVDPHEPDLSGDFHLRLDATGTIAPVAVTGSGRLEASATSIAARPLGDAVIPFRMEWRTEGLTWTTGRFELLGGTGLVDGTLADGIADATLNLESIAADRIALLAGLPGLVSGRINASGSVVIPIHRPADATGAAHWSGEHISYNGVHADRASGEIDADEGRIRVTGFEAVEGEGRITGMAELPRRGPGPIEFQLRAERWPIAISNAAARLDGAFHGAADPRTLAVRGDGDLIAIVDLAGRTARLESGLSLDGARATADPIRATVGGGIVTGYAIVPLDDWPAARADLEWSDVDLHGLAPINGLTGTVSGRASIGPDPSPTALGPVRLTASMDANGGAYRGAPWTRLTLDLRYGHDRTTMERLELDTAGGTVVATGSTVLHGPERFVSARAVLDGIDLAPIAAAIDPESQGIRGRLRGNVFAAGYIDEPHRLFGQAELEVSEAEFASLPGLTTIYDELRVRGRGAPDGEGRATVRMEGHALEISRFHYFGRGVDIVGQARMHDIRAGTSSELSGLVVGLVRPFKNVGLPFGRALDQFLEAIQTDAVNVLIGGTVGNPERKTVPYAAVADKVGRMLDAIVK